MANAVTSLSMVREELFTIVAEIEQSLGQYLESREDRQALQLAKDRLQQLSGTLSLLELGGAELLIGEVLLLVEQINDQPVTELSEHFYAIKRGLYVTERYLECVEQDEHKAPEVLLPEINELRKQLKRHPLAEGDFYYGSAQGVRSTLAKPLTPKDPELMARRLRQMYQIGLLGYLRDTPDANLTLMRKALTRLDRLYVGQDAHNLFWIAAAALEACEQGQLSPSYERKYLLARLDRQIKHSSADINAKVENGLLKDLLYVVALAQSQGPLAQAVREAYEVLALPYTEADLLAMREALKGPGLRVYSSLAGVLHEELASAKDELDLIERGTAAASTPEQLLTRLHSLEKTFDTVGLPVAAEQMQQASSKVQEWMQMPDNRLLLDSIAKLFLVVEGAVTALQKGNSEVQEVEQDVFYVQQLAEAKIVVTDEARIALSMAQRAVTGYLESNGDKMYLAAVPVALHGASGGLRFLEQTELAEFIQVAAEFIAAKMLEADLMPDTQALQALANALTGVEYMLERGVSALSQDGSSVFALTQASIDQLQAELA